MVSRREKLNRELHEILNDKAGLEAMRKQGRAISERTQQLYSMYKDSEFDGSFEDWLKNSSKPPHASDETNLDDKDTPQNNL